MSQTIKMQRLQVVQGNPVAIAARAVDMNRDLLVQANITSITCTVTDIREQEETYSESVSVAESVFNTLQFGDAWTIDDQGYNMLAKVPGSAFPLPNRKYQVEFKFVSPSGDEWVSPPITIDTTHRYSE